MNSLRGVRVTCEESPDPLGDLFGMVDEREVARSDRFEVSVGHRSEGFREPFGEYPIVLRCDDERRGTDPFEAFTHVEFVHRFEAADRRDRRRPRKTFEERFEVVAVRVGEVARYEALVFFEEPCES